MALAGLWTEGYTMKETIFDKLDEIDATDSEVAALIVGMADGLEQARPGTLDKLIQNILDRREQK